MKERPILFSAPMVRAILEGRKTQTRRIVKPQPSQELLDDYAQIRRERGVQKDDAEMLSECLPCPYGVPGDRLWVRETWGLFDPDCSGAEYEHGPIGAHGGELMREGSPLRDYWQRRIAYAATWEDQKYGSGPDKPTRWRPSIHMPRWASRITLEIADVRVERLQEISEADAEAEGLTCRDGLYATSGEVWQIDPRKAYRDLWKSLHGEGSWAANTWVWVIEFKRVEA